MQFLFMDNFRGFSETIVPIRNVNFLVGENSTGKSSFLTLLTLMSRPGFWFLPSFSVDNNYYLGGFKDMVSASSKFKNRFTVGLLTMMPRRGNDREDYKFGLMEFRNEEGMPKLKRYIEFNKGQLIKIHFAGKTAKYKSNNEKVAFNTETAFLQFVRKIFREDLEDKRDFSKIPLDNVRQFPLPFLSTFAQSKTLDKKKVEVLSGRLAQPLVDFTWLAPIRTKPSRIYHGFKTAFTPEGNHTPYVLKKTLHAKKTAPRMMDLIRFFGEESGLFSRVTAHSFGKDPSAPFEVRVELPGASLNIANVGYGVSQVLPVIVEMLTCPKGNWFAIQQPEVHLHPRAQAALGQLMQRLAQERNHSYVVETHSDYLIDRFRLRLKEEGGPKGCQIIFFERTEKGNKVHFLPIDEKGRYPKKPPKGFRDFFIREEISLLDI